MPQATRELSAKMDKMFGCGVDDKGPMDYLTQHGYKLTDKWTWKKEGINSYEAMTQDEYDCLLFLVQEWDMGGLEIDDANSD